MSNHLTPREAFDKWSKFREGVPLPAGNPYKLENARVSLRDMLSASERYLRFAQCGSSGALKASEQGHYITEQLCNDLPFDLGYAAIPGLAVMDRPDLVAELDAVVGKKILPEATAICAMPRDVLQLEAFVGLLRYTFGIVDQMLSTVEVRHG